MKKLFIKFILLLLASLAGIAQAAPLTVTTNAATSLAATGATLNGTIGNGSNTAVTFNYGLTTSYGSSITATPSPVTGSSAVSAAVTGLTCNTTYNFRVTGGATNGSNLTFTTTACAPAVTTNNASSLSSTGATLNGTVSSNGASTTVTFAYGLDTTYGSLVTATASPLSSSSSNSSVTAAVTGLTCNTTYHFRVIGGNTAGTTNGSDLNFTTSACPAPTVTTNSATSLVATGATLNGTVSSNGASTTASFDYGTSTNYGSSATADQSPLASNANGTSITATISGLTCNTVYHFRAKGVSSYGSANGFDQTLTTSACVYSYVSIATGGWSTATTWAVLKSGTITTDTASTTVVGTGTSFTSLAVGSKLYTPNGVLIGTISSIASDTSLTLTANAASANAGIAYYGTSSTTPGAADTATIASPNNVTLGSQQQQQQQTFSISNVTVNSGGTLTFGSGQSNATLNVSGNITNNGTITASGSSILQALGSNSIISGTGTYSGSLRLYIGAPTSNSSSTPSIAAGSTLTFANSASIRIGRTGSSTAASTVLTINGTIKSTQTSGATLMSFYSASTFIGSTGIINAANAAIAYQSTTATVTNNGSVTVQKITYKTSNGSSSNKWTQGNYSSLTVSMTSTVGTLYASATGNTVTYNGTQTADVEIGYNAPTSPVLSPLNTYYNLAGTALHCPTNFSVFHSTCATGGGSATNSPASCSSLPGTGNSAGSVDWIPNPSGSTLSAVTQAVDGKYAQAGLTNGAISKSLVCTNYGFAIPAGSIINGITVSVDRMSSGGTVKDYLMRLVKNVNGVATVQLTDQTMPTTYPQNTPVFEDHGGPTNLWSGTWTVADINSTNFGAAFAATNTSTRTSSRTVSVDNMPITVSYTLPASAPDHVAVYASNVGSTCNPGAVTITLHNANHTLLTGWSGTITLSTSDSTGDWSLVTGSGTLNNGTANDGVATYAFSSSESSVTLNLTHTTTGAITLGVATGATNLLTKTPGGELANSISYSANGSFSIISNASGTPVPVTNLNMVAGQTSPTYYLYAINNACASAFNSVAQTIQFATECNDPIACQNAPAVVTITPSGGTATALQKGVGNGTLPTSGQYTNVSMNFNANSRAPFTMAYADVGKITLYMNYVNGGTTIFSESNPLVVKPAAFVLSNIACTTANAASCGAGALAMATPGNNPAAADATGGAFIEAGDAFSLAVTAVNTSGTATPNFGHEVNTQGVQMISALSPVMGSQASNPTITCSDPTNATTCNSATGVPLLGAFSGGAATGNNFAWNEVGILRMAAAIANGDYMGAGDVGTTGAISSGSTTLTVGSATGISVGSNLIVVGAGASGGNFATTATAVSGTTITLANSAATTVTAPASGSNVYLSSGNIGRFYPDHFSVVPDANSPLDNRYDTSDPNVQNLCSLGLASDGVTACVPAADCVGGVLVADGVTTCIVAPGFTYMGEKLVANFTLIANNLGGGTTQNYAYSATAANNFAKPNATQQAIDGGLGLGAVDKVGSGNLTSRLDRSLVDTNIWNGFSGGSVLVAAPIGFTRGTSPDGNYTALSIGVAPVDADGVTAASSAFDMGVPSFDHVTVGTTEVRYGRMKIANATGSNVLPLPLSLTAQYWSNGDWVTSTDDANTLLLISNILLGNYQRKVAGDTWTTSLTLPSGTATNGVWGITLSKPSGTFTARGSVDVTTNAPPYLPFTTGRATFGVFTGNRNNIYIRENY